MSTHNKRGRPFSENAMRHDLKVRVDDETNKGLIEYSEKHDITIAETIRRAIKAFLRVNE